MSKESLIAFMRPRKRDATLLTWFRFIHLLKKLLPRIDCHLKQWDLSKGQFDLLAEVATDEGINQQTCAERLHVTKGNIAQHMKNLESRGFMRREKCGRDNHIFLTEKGRDLFMDIIPEHDEFIRKTLAEFSPKELERFGAMLRKLERSIH